MPIRDFSEHNDIAAALEAGEELGQQLGQVRRISDKDIPFALVPASTHGTLVSLEKFLRNPLVTRAKVEARTPAAFIAYVGRFATDETAIFWWEPSRQVVGVIDYHTPSEAHRRQHRATFSAQYTPEFAPWAAIHGRLMKQSAFAEHVEDNLHTIAEPPGADLLEMAQVFNVYRETTFRSVNRIKSGTVQLTYAEEDKPSSNVSVPDVITLMVAPFEGNAPRPIKAQLRYRLDGGNLNIGIKLLDLERVIREAFMDLVKEIQDAAELVGVPKVEANVLVPELGNEG